MADKELMEDILLLEKNVCDLYMHGSIEAATGNVQQNFRTALSDALAMQGATYGKMAARGWYTAEQADASKVSAARQKFGGAGC